MSPLGSVKHEVGRLNKEIFDVYDAIERQRMTVEEARHVINTVIAGKLQYSMQTVGLPRTFLERVDTRSARVIKLKAGVGVTAPREGVFIPCDDWGLGVLCFADLQDSITITENLIRLNSEGLAGEVTRAVLATEKDRLGIMSSPLDKRGLEQSSVVRSTGTSLRHLQGCLKRRGYEVRTKDLSMHVKRARSLHMSQVMQNTGEMEWSVMGHRLKGNDTVEDWCFEEGGEVRVKEFGDMVNEERLTGRAPTQVYCLVRHMLTGGASGEGEIKSGLVDPSFMGSTVEEGMHLESVRDSIEPVVAVDEETGSGEIEVGTDGGRTEATDDEPVKVGYGWVAVSAGDSLEHASPLVGGGAQRGLAMAQV